MTAASAVFPAGAKVCWCGTCGAATAATAFVPTGAKSVGVGETSRQKSVDVEQLMQRVEEQFRKNGPGAAGAYVAFFFEKKMRERCERLEQVEEEGSPSY